MEAIDMMLNAIRDLLVEGNMDDVGNRLTNLTARLEHELQEVSISIGQIENRGEWLRKERKMFFIRVRDKFYSILAELDENRERVATNRRGGAAIDYDLLKEMKDSLDLLRIHVGQFDDDNDHRLKDMMQRIDLVLGDARVRYSSL